MTGLLDRSPVARTGPRSGDRGAVRRDAWEGVGNGSSTGRSGHRADRARDRCGAGAGGPPSPRPGSAPATADAPAADRAPARGAETPRRRHPALAAAAGRRRRPRPSPSPGCARSPGWSRRCSWRWSSSSRSPPVQRWLRRIGVPALAGDHRAAAARLDVLLAFVALLVLSVAQMAALLPDYAGPAEVLINAVVADLNDAGTRLRPAVRPGRADRLRPGGRGRDRAARPADRRRQHAGPAADRRSSSWRSSPAASAAGWRWSPPSGRTCRSR